MATTTDSLRASDLTPPSRTMTELYRTAVGAHAGAALAYKEGGRWVEVSYAELDATTRAIGKGLIALGIEPRERIAILANTRPEWTYADLGALCAGAVVAPIYQTNSPEECQYVLAHSESRLVFCEDAEQVRKVAAIRSECPDLRHVVVLDGEAEGAMTLDELRAAGAEVSDERLDERARGVRAEDLCTLIYTSGTTGPPKGCVLTHANFAAAVEMFASRLTNDGEPLRFFAFLPLAHSFTRAVQMVSLHAGATLAYWERDPKRIVANLAEAAPTHLPAVPRIFEKIHRHALGTIDDRGGLETEVFRRALATGRRVRALERAGQAPSPVLRARHALGDRLALSRVRALFGPNLRFAISGAAPIGVEVLEFFAACGVTIVEGWGLSETFAAATLGEPGDPMLGTVGTPLPGVEVRVAQDGELLIGGPQVFQGYFKDEAATREALVDGWLHTGDLGTVDATGRVLITGRKKDLIITSSGKNISPANIEDELKVDRWIGNAVVSGDNRPYLVALITLDPDEAPRLAERLGITPDLATMAVHPGVREEIARAVARANERFARIEQVKRFTILDHDLSVAGGELTPTMKVKRATVRERYGDVIDALYAD